MAYNKFINQVQTQLDQEFAGIATVSLTGVSVLLEVIMEKSIYSSAISYVLAFVLISIMMIVLIGNVKIGLISMIPNIAPILFLSTIMVIFDMPLDMFNFGVLTASAIFVALLADFFLVPAIMKLIIHNKGDL